MTLDAEEVCSCFEYLDNLRESGCTNMFGADSYMIRDLGYDKSMARTMLLAWMEHYDDEVSASDRADKYISNK